MTKTEATKLKEKVLAHYDRMIEWASKQPQEERQRTLIMSVQMTSELGENWGGSYCPLCKSLAKDEHCFNCPVYYYTNEEDCKKTPWNKIPSSKTWSEFIVNATAEKEFLEKVMTNYIKKVAE